MLGADFVKPPDFFKTLAVEWQDFNTQELLMATWGAATGAPEVHETHGVMVGGVESDGR